MSDIEPALSPEEWAEFLDPSQEWAYQVYANKSEHSAAAVGLHGQPFGFTWEDVDHLRSQADWYEEQTRDVVYACPDDMKPAFRLRQLADRITALLPPREP